MVNAEAILETLGQKPSKKKSQSAADTVIELIRTGMPARSLDRLAGRLRIPISEVQKVLGLPPATAARKRASKAALKPAISDRIVRIANIWTIAASVLESEDKASAWLQEPNRALGGAIPLHMLDTEIGAREVERVLHRLEYGVYS